MNVNIFILTKSPPLKTTYSVHRHLFMLNALITKAPAFFVSVSLTSYFGTTYITLAQIGFR